MTENEQAVLAVNEAFYDAFSCNDNDAMESLWSSGAEVAVIHPGWPPLYGRKAVMESWRRLFSGNGAAGGIRCLAARAFVYAEAAFVICHESLEAAELVATNIYVREGDDWKMVHHQAGPRPASGHQGPPEALH